MARMPTLFVSHGAPTFALQPGELGPRLAALGRQLAGVKAILVVSPHWQTRKLSVLTTAKPATVHDFGGFDPALYQLQYPAAGAPELAREAMQALSAAGFGVEADGTRGLDHGVWVPLWHMRPAADLPVFQVSLPVSLDTAAAVRLGRALAPLRDQGVLIVGSGGMTHNLYEFRQSGSGTAAAYVREFAGWTRAAVEHGELEQLVAYRRLAPHAERAHPTEEHFLPLLVAMGASDADDEVRFIEGGITHGVLAMDSYAWGLKSAQGPQSAPATSALA